MEGLGSNPEPFRYAPNMDSSTQQLLMNVAFTIIGLVLLKIGLDVWDRKAKAKEAAAEVEKKAAAKAKAKTKKK